MPVSNTSALAHRTPTRACLIALGALPVVDPEVRGPIGGTETRAFQFAKGLAARDDTSASLVVRTPVQRSVFHRDQVEIIPRHERLFALYESVGQSVEKSHRFPGIRLRRWSPSLLWQLPLLAAHRTLSRRPRDPGTPDPFFQRLSADVFVPFGVQSTSATVIASAHEARRPAVLILGSDVDLDDRYRPGSTFISPYGDRGDVCHSILMQADAIVAQTESQQDLLKDRFGRKSVLIRNPIDVAEWDARQAASLNPADAAGLDRFVLWVGRAESVHKRPKVCLELAQMLPDVNFLMILNPRDPAVEADVRRNAPSNIRIVPRVPFEHMPTLFSHAAALVNTSSMEGFPNVFLQAAVSRVPVASLNVGEELLGELSSGCLAAGDLSTLSEFLQDIWRGEGPDAETLNTAREWVVEHHALPTQTERLFEVISSVAGSLASR